MADLNYVSPLTSDLTDYYTKTEVDELQQGDAATYATTAQVDSKDNAVKNWVENKGYLTQHQSLANYATKNYVDDAIAGVEVPSGVSIEVVNALPSIQNAQENVIYLVLDDSSNTGNIYNEWIYVPAAEDFEMIGNTAEGVIPDLTDYATKAWVGQQGYITSVDAKDVAYDNDASGLEANNVKNAIDEVYAAIPTVPVLATVATSGDYDDLSNKPTIPSLTGYATTTYVDDAVGAISIPDVSEFITAADIPDVSGFVESSDLATVATSGSYNDLSDKPSIPSISGLATESYVNTAVGNISIPDVSNFITAQDLPDVSIYAETANLATVATSGDYDDLTNKPSIPDTTGLASETWVQSQGYLTSHQDISGKVDGTVISGTTTAKIFNEADGGGAQIITASARGFAGVHDGSNPDATYATMYVKNAAGTSTLARVDLDGDGKAYYLKNGASKATGSEIAVKGDIPDVSDFITANDLPDLTGYVESSDLATVATSGDYDDLTNKPTIPSLSGYATETWVGNQGYAVAANLATVATSGDYDDLTNKPTIPSLSGYATESWVGQQGYLTQHQDISGKANSADLATVATSGSYTDLSNKPDLSGYLTSSDLSGYAQSSSLATVATSGSYNDLSDKPTIPQNTGIAYAYPDFSLGDNNAINTTNKSDLISVLKGGGVAKLNNGSQILNFQDDLGMERVYVYELNSSYELVGNPMNNPWTSYTIPGNSFAVYKHAVGGQRGSLIYTSDLSRFSKWIFNQPLYSNTTSGLTATTFQEAIDELAASAGGSFNIQDVLDAVVDGVFVAEDGNGASIEVGINGFVAANEVSDNGTTTTNQSSINDNVISREIHTLNATTGGTDDTLTIDTGGIYFTSSTTDSNSDVTSDLQLSITPNSDFNGLIVEWFDNVEGTSDALDIATTDLLDASEISYDDSNTSNGVYDNVQDIIDDIWTRLITADYDTNEGVMELTGLNLIFDGGM